MVVYDGIEMKTMYWELKGNQGFKYVSICFSMIELMFYVWWLSYRLICNHYGWNESSILRVERKSRYHVTYTFICFNMIVLMCYVWWLSYRIIYNHFGWNETSVLGVERKSRYHGYICIYKFQNGWNDMIIVMTEWRVYMQSFWLKWD